MSLSGGVFGELIVLLQNLLGINFKILGRTVKKLKMNPVVVGACTVGKLCIIVQLYNRVRVHTCTII